MSNVKIKVSTASVSTLISVHALLKDCIWQKKKKMVPREKKKHHHHRWKILPKTLYPNLIKPLRLVVLHGGSFCPWGTFAMSVDIFGGHNWGGGEGVLGI